MKRSLFDCDVGFDCGEEFVGFHHVFRSGSGEVALATISDVRFDGFESHALLVEVEELIHLGFRQQRNFGVGFAPFGPNNKLETVRIACLFVSVPTLPIRRLITFMIRII
jgi:hypothetical protein